VGKAADWLKEERRKTLGDWVAFCLGCGAVFRYFDESELRPECPQCGGQLRSRRPACDARIANAFAVECEECAAPLRPAELFGTPIRKRR